MDPSLLFHYRPKAVQISAAIVEWTNWETPTGP